MLTEERQSTGESSLDAIQSVALAVSILASRFRRLPLEDREILLELLQHWFKTDDQEEQESALRAVEELLAQGPIVAHPVALTSESKLSRRRKTWTEKVGRKIRALREQASLNQADLAGRTGLTQSHISRLENAEHSPTYLTLTKIATALGVDVEVFES
jgi:DNA-binding XRE family transcriptional regulator